MKTEDQIRNTIEHHRDALTDHHLYLNEPHVIEAVTSVYESVIRILSWVVEDKLCPRCASILYDEDGDCPRCSHIPLKDDREPDESIIVDIEVSEVN